MYDNLSPVGDDDGSPKRTSPAKYLQPYRAANSREKLKTNTMIRMLSSRGRTESETERKIVFPPESEGKASGRNEDLVRKSEVMFGFTQFTYRAKGRR